jgi:hypothetical protein
MKIQYVVEGQDMKFSVKTLKSTDSIDTFKSSILRNPQLSRGVLRGVVKTNIDLYKVSTTFWSGNNTSTDVLCSIRWTSTSMVVPGNLLHL